MASRSLAAQAATGAFFAIIDGSSAGVSNLHLREVDIDGSGSIGALAGRLTGGATVEGASMSGSVDAGIGTFDFVGGLLGQSIGSTVQNSYATGNVNGGAGGNDYVGGLVGVIRNNTTIQNNYATGNVNGEADPLTFSAVWWGRTATLP